jgi:hypothetical protein
VFGDLDRQIDVKVEEIKVLDLKGKNVLLSLDEVTSIRKAFAYLQDLLKLKDSLVFQRSRR